MGRQKQLTFKTLIFANCWASELVQSNWYQNNIGAKLTHWHIYCVRRSPWIAITLVTPNSDGPDDERQIEEAVRAGTFAQSNWLPKSMTNVTSSYVNSAKWVIWYWWLLPVVFPSLLLFWLLIPGSFYTFSLNLEKVMPMMIKARLRRLSELDHSHNP